MKKRKLTMMMILGTALIVLLAACGDHKRTSSARQTQEQPLITSPSEKAAVVIENRGEKLVFPEAPKRAITLNQHATEVMLALGLEESMVGTAYLDDRILPEFKAKYDKIPILSEKYPSKEVFLAASPDFAYAGWESAFTEKSLGLRSDLAKQGVLTYVQESSNKPSPTLEDVFQDILNIGRIFRVDGKAKQVVNDIRKKLEDIQARIGTVSKPLQVFVYDSGDDKAFTAANTYLTSLINTVGAKNIFDDLNKGWTEVSWEEVVARNPDVIVVVDYGDTTAAKKIELLQNKASLVDVDAIKNKRFIVLPLSAAAEGIRAPIALQTLAEGLYPDQIQP
ncbi:ABC transporter substrate-binding protein [Paenibacillus lycopersici]|uniref:ABC transporter substrate-binding protein n=1 Tax=Paenibacillus lycopersici TaxID=2704462 RepID=A0A6C0G6E4_9BACL|nr:ABC transporter substrate-binding protein [Paenibacillus lycopersici]QHT61075.1 ABC transporter substrate-binding protein [Paenibacillus lycopersici]